MAVADPIQVQPAPAIPALPDSDPFYNPPPDVVAATPPGGIIAVRQINVANYGLLPVNVDAWLVSYRSNDHLDHPVGAVATLLKPRGTSKSPRKLLSTQIAEDSPGVNCAPSYALQQWSAGPTLLGQSVAPAEFLMAQSGLAQGWAVVVPDHEGPKGAYAAGPLGGRITLDAIRAAESFQPLEVAADSPVALYGYSGGSMPTGWAAELHKTYAPELNIVGVAEGGVGADLGMTLTMADNQATSGLVLAAIMGLSHEYPEFAAYLDQRMNPLGKTLTAAKSGLCVAYTAALLPFLNLKGLINTAGDPLNDPPVASVIADTKMGKTVPDVPMFVWQSDWDEILPKPATTALVNTYCQDPSARVQYTTDLLSEHGAAAVTGGPGALLWLRDRLDGVPVEGGCHAHDAVTMLAEPGALGSAAQIVGTALAGALNAPIGAK
ncbi:lipase family protein [Nocardia nova]|uniref:lipase family protein n=1 Tax=Nocardia nova TaxID=37330 RepID=UPI0033D998F3